MSWYSYGINSYEYFLKNKKPNWNEILKTRLDKKYSIIVLDNNSGIDGKEILHFDYEKLKRDFRNVLSLRKADFTKFPVFGFLFIETKSGKDEEINKILKSNLREYITIIK